MGSSGDYRLVNEHHPEENVQPTTYATQVHTQRGDGNNNKSPFEKKRHLPRHKKQEKEITEKRIHTDT